MGLKSFDQHKESLRDGREVYFDGERVTGGPPLIKEIGTDALLPCTSSPATWTAIWAQPSSRRSGGRKPTPRHPPSPTS